MSILWISFFYWNWKLKKIEYCTILIPKGNSYCRHKSSARGPRFKVSSEGLSAKIGIPIWSPIQVAYMPRSMLLKPRLGGWP